MIDCAGLTTGAPVLACYSSQTDYLIGWSLLILIGLIIFFNLAGEPMRLRLSVTMLSVSVLAMLGSVRGIFFPETYFIYTMVLAIGAAVMLFIRS